VVKFSQGCPERVWSLFYTSPLLVERMEIRPLSRILSHAIWGGDGQLEREGWRRGLCLRSRLLSIHPFALQRALRCEVRSHDRFYGW